MHHQLFCLGMVLKLFGRNFDSPLHVDGYHRPLGGDDEGGWKHEKSLIRFFQKTGRVYQLKLRSWYQIDYKLGKSLKNYEEFYPLSTLIYIHTQGAKLLLSSFEIPTLVIKYNLI